MNLSLFIAKRLSGKKEKSFSSGIIRLAMLGVSISVAVMIISTSTVGGFKNGISDKISGFNGHIIISHQQNQQSFEQWAFEDTFTDNYFKSAKSIIQVAGVAIKPAIIKTEEEMDGIVLKGIDSRYPVKYLQNNLLSGTIPLLSDTVSNPTILISKTTAKKLKLKINDKMRLFFVSADKSGNNRVKALAPVVCGIFETGFEEHDKTFAIIPLKFLQKTLSVNTESDSVPDTIHPSNNFTSNGNHNQLITRYEIWVDNINNTSEAYKFINSTLPGNLKSETIFTLYKDIFDWLDVLNNNVEIILALMIIVACINMITVLLILIIDRTRMIGLLKALGAQNFTIRNIFIFNAFFILISGLFWGNVLGVGLCWIQQKWGLISLNQETYYVSKVLISIDWINVLYISIGTTILCVTFLIIPSWVITKISPVKAIKFN